MSADADRIACRNHQHGMWRERCIACVELRLDAERTAHERTKAELTAERADRLNIDEHRGRLMRERGAALAEAAAMRLAIDAVVIRLSHENAGSEEALQRLRDALDCTAGRALAARVPLLEGIAEGLKIWRDGLDVKRSRVEKFIFEEIVDRFPALTELAALDEKGGTDDASG